MDITDVYAVESVIHEICPDAVVHCAAWTAVDDAEDAGNYSRVYAVNATGTGNVVEAADRVGVKMVYISTDYVFDGTGDIPWKPDSKDFGPLCIYGKSKLDGERAVEAATDRFFIVRIAWVFGRNGSNFVKTMLNVGRKYPEVRVVNDQIGSPTYTADLAVLLLDMAETEKYGYYHATNEGDYISWYDFCCEIYQLAGLQTDILPVATEEYGMSKAVRPKNSRLDRCKLVEAGFVPLPDWKDALKRFLHEIGEI